MSELPSARTVGGTPLARHLICLAVCLAALGIVALRFAGLRKRTETPPAPLEVSLWYWHSPFRLEAKECDLLRALNIRSLYVRAGTIERGENGVTAVLPQTWEQIGPNAPAVHLVFNFDYSMVRHFSELDNATIAGVVAGAAKQARSRAEAAGLRVIGVQMDFDCATKRLPKYADLLRKIRTALASPDLQLSITALETWYENGDLSGVLDGIDFAVPQYYEANLPASIAHFSPVSDFKAAARGLERAERFGKPFYAGLPAYGHALMTDETGKILGLYREMTADNATRHPAFQFVRAFPANANGQPAQNSQNSIGENLAGFRRDSQCAGRARQRVSSDLRSADAAAAGAASGAHPRKPTIALSRRDSVPLSRTGRDHDVAPARDCRRFAKPNGAARFEGQNSVRRVALGTDRNGAQRETPAARCRRFRDELRKQRYVFRP